MTVRLGSTIRETLQTIDTGRIRCAIVTDLDGRLVGIATDGDIRRALLQGASLDEPIDPCVERQPLTVAPQTSRVDILDLMRSRNVSVVPIVDESRHLFGLHLLHEVLSRDEIPNWGLVVAGGRGTRLGDLTSNTPKPLLPVAGRPVIEWIILQLVSAGVRRVYVNTGYLAEQIEDYLGDGSLFGCSISYLRDPESTPIGSGGALALLNAHRPQHPIISINADLMTRFDLRGMLSSHVKNGNALTVATRIHSIQLPFGVVNIRPDGAVSEIHEKPTASWNVNAGIYVVDPKLLDLACSNRDFPMTELIQSCLDAGHPVGHWEIDGDWIDIGRPQDLREARGTA